MRRLPNPPILLITDRRQATLPIAEVVAAAIEGGCRWIMLREKDLPAPDLAALARRLAPMARAAGATLLVNGDLAAAALAGGVHLPQGRSIAEARAALGDGALIGSSAHGLEEAEAARRLAADYATLSPVFLSGSKPSYGPALQPRGFAAIARQVALPLIALGGIEPDTVAISRHAGAAGVAVMGSVMRSARPAHGFRMLADAWRNA